MKYFSAICRPLIQVIFLCCLLVFSITALAKTITILTFNDFHGQLAEDKGVDGKNLGMAKFVAAVKAAEKQYPNTIVLSGGDNYQGSPLSNLTFGAPVNEMMKLLNVKVSAVGNHEFDWGTKWFKTWMQQGDFVYLAANIYDKKTGKLVSWAKPYIIINKDGVKIALIGLATLETPDTTKRSNVKNLIFKNDVKCAQKWINYLKAGKDPQGKPDVIIALTHIPSFQDAKTNNITGKELINLCKHTKGLNAVISAHSHLMVSGYVANIPVVQAFCNGRALGKLTISLNDHNKLESITPAVIELYKEKATIQPDPTAEKIFNKYQSQIATQIGQVIGQASEELSHNTHEQPNVTPLGQWAANVIKNRFKTQVAIINGGNLRRSLHKGNVTIGDIYEIEPFDNAIVTMKVSGKELKQIIEHGILNPNMGDGQFAGLKVKIDSSKPFGHRIIALKLANGQPIKMHRYYTVATCDFVYTGGDGYDFSKAKDVVNTHILMRDVFLDAVKQQKIITPTPVNCVEDIASKTLPKAA